MCPTPASSISRAVALCCGVASRRRRSVPEAGCRRPVSASISSVWPFPSTPAIATISRGVHVERDAAHLLEAAIVEDVEVVDLEQRRRPAVAAALSTRSSTSRPTIILARLSSVAPFAGTVSIVLPRRSTVIRSATSSTSWSLCEMKMIDFPCAFSSAMIAKSSRRLLRRQDGGRLVQDEDLRPAVERLQDLDALLLGDRDVLDAARRGRRRGRSGRRARGRASAPRRSRASRPRRSAPRRGRCSRPPSSPGSA